jgi:SAM-dependent methyltransferase
MFRRYLASHPVRKLQIGAGGNAIEGWLSTDIRPISPDVAYLDAARPFPFADQTFDYVYCEHMIEHIPWRRGLALLRECRRVLKPGGALRVATPNLAAILGLRGPALDPVADRYVTWVTSRYLEGLPGPHPTFVINNAFRNWGHQFLYDEHVLRLAMGEAGFDAVAVKAWGESDEEHFRGLEYHDRVIKNREMAEFETMILEGVAAA